MSTSVSGKFHADFLRYLRRHPQAQVAAIVRCREMRPEHVHAIAQANVQVVRPLRLIRAYAVQGQADALLALAAKPWVLAIEPDQPVHTTQ